MFYLVEVKTYLGVDDLIERWATDVFVFRDRSKAEKYVKEENELGTGFSTASHLTFANKITFTTL